MIKITPADMWFSRCVRERADWFCERCKVRVADPRGLHCAHVMSRGHHSVRHDPCNALALCYGCHRYTEQNRERVFLPLVKSIFGENEFDRVFSDAFKPANGIKRRIKDIAKHYRAEFERMRGLRDAGIVGRLEFSKWEP